MKSPLTGRKIHPDGRVEFDERGIIDAIYNGVDMDEISASDSGEIVKYNESCEEFGQPENKILPTQKNTYNHHKWLIENERSYDDIIDILYSKCPTERHRERVEMELSLYEKNNMTDILICMDYLVSVMRKHEIVWGVGRGSSVSSYVLYLLGLHHIDPLEFDLDIHEFLRE